MEKHNILSFPIWQPCSERYFLPVCALLEDVGKKANVLQKGFL